MGTGGRDSREWHQGQGHYAGYRWYGDVSVDNFNAVLYGYAIYYDLAADAEQKKFIAHDVDRLMTHLLDNHCRIIDVDGEVTQWGHVGMDPDPARDEYYKKSFAQYLSRAGLEDAPWKPSLRGSLMSAARFADRRAYYWKERYRDFYQRVVTRCKDNPDLSRRRESGPFSLERVARVNHSSEGQSVRSAIQFDPLRIRSRTSNRIPFVGNRFMGDELDGRQFALRIYDACSIAGIPGTAKTRLSRKRFLLRSLMARKGCV